MNCLTQSNHLGSQKFGFISSENLVNQLENHGLTLDKVVEMKIRKDKELRQGFQKHKMLFNTQHKSNEGTLQLLVTNSHEGSSALKFQLGFFRLICSNGLVVGSNIVSPISLRHSINQVEFLNDTISMVLNQNTKVFESIDELKQKRFTPETLTKFKNDALNLRGYDLNKKGLLLPNFTAKRVDDLNDDVFTIMNVIQENMLRTGFVAHDDKGDAVKFRAIKSIDEQNRVNAGLWDLAIAA